MKVFLHISYRKFIASFLILQYIAPMLAIKTYLIFSMLAIIVFDVRKYIIPNWIVGSLLVLYPISLWYAPVAVDWKMALAAMFIVFAVGYVVFAMRWMGAGDVKFITVCALWVGYSSLFDFIFLFAILGGLLSGFLWGFRKMVPSFAGRLPFKELPRILQDGAPVPYGVAIAIAFLFILWTNKIPVLMG
jgi:prepilin peptidase CpaA